MIRLSKIWYRVVIVVVIVAAGLTTLFAQKNDVPISQEANPSDNTNEDDTATKVELQSKDPVSRPSVVNTDSTTAVDIQRGFNELKSEYLDDRADYIDMWLTVIAIVLTFFGLVVVVLGYFGIKKFQELEARAEKSVEKIEENLALSKARLQETTSIDLVDPEKTPEIKKTIQDVQSDPDPSFIDKVLTEIYTLQLNGRVEEAVEKWRSVANIAEGTDNNLASRAWLSIAYLLPEGDNRLTAYDKAMDLNPDYTRSPRNQPISRYSMLFHDTIVVEAALRYFNDPKFERFTAQKDIAERDYGADVILHDEKGQLAVIVECKVNEYIARSAVDRFKEYFRHSNAKFGLLAVGTNLSKWTFFRILGNEITPIERSEFEKEVTKSEPS